jgi:hypothetical protein
MHFTLKMEAARTSEMLISFITTRRHKQEDCYFDLIAVKGKGKVVPAF